MHKISGVFSAALTPVKNDLSINKDLYLRHCQYLMRQGHDGLGIFGTGEANSFSVQEKRSSRFLFLIVLILISLCQELDPLL